MKNVHICLLILIFFGCANPRSLNNQINISFLPSSNMIELLKKLREYELIVEDHFIYSKKSFNNETVKEKIKDINYVKSLTDRYDKWYINWDKKLGTIGKDLNDKETILLKHAMKGVFDIHLLLNSLNPISDHISDLYPSDSLFLNEY